MPFNEKQSKTQEKNDIFIKKNKKHPIKGFFKGLKVPCPYS
jgi:hypothetical protein